MGRSFESLISPAQTSPPELSHSVASTDSRPTSLDNPARKNKVKDDEFRIDCLEVASNSTVSVRVEEPEADRPLRLTREPIAPIRHPLLQPPAAHPLLAPPSSRSASGNSTSRSTATAPTPAPTTHVPFTNGPVRSAQAAQPAPPPGPPPRIPPPAAPTAARGRARRPRGREFDPNAPPCVVSSCLMSAIKRSVACEAHTCFARNVDGSLCPNIASSFGTVAFPTYCKQGYHTENGRWHLAQRFIENKQKEIIQEQIRVEADRAHRQIELERLAKLARADRYLQGFEPDLSEYAEQIARTQSLGGCSRIRQQPQPLAGLPLRIALGQVDLNRFGSSSVPTNGHGTDQSKYLMSMPDYMLHTRPWSLTGRSRKTLAEVIEARHQAHLEELRQQELARQELVRQRLVQQARSR